jgi:serine O-acetyltransferase
VLGPRNTIGENFSIYQNVTIGQRRLASPTEKVCIGDNVQLFAGCKVLGSLSVGSGTRLAANAVLLTDTESDSGYAGIPAVKIK